MKALIARYKGRVIAQGLELRTGRWVTTVHHPNGRAGVEYWPNETTARLWIRNVTDARIVAATVDENGEER